MLRPGLGIQKSYRCACHRLLQYEWLPARNSYFRTKASKDLERSLALPRNYTRRQAHRQFVGAISQRIDKPYRLSGQQPTSCTLQEPAAPSVGQSTARHNCWILLLSRQLLWIRSVERDFSDVNLNLRSL